MARHEQQQDEQEAETEEASKRIGPEKGAPLRQKTVLDFMRSGANNRKDGTAKEASDSVQTTGDISGLLRQAESHRNGTLTNEGAVGSKRGREEPSGNGNKGGSEKSTRKKQKKLNKSSTAFTADVHDDIPEMIMEMACFAGQKSADVKVRAPLRSPTVSPKPWHRFFRCAPLLPFTFHQLESINVPCGSRTTSIFLKGQFV